MQTVNLKRKDGQIEDDFKTWAHAVLVTPAGNLCQQWYSSETDANLAKTSVRNPAKFAAHLG